MKLTEQEIKMFERLNGSPLGAKLVDYLGRVLTEYCDVRHIPKGSEEAMKMAANLIEEEIIGRIRLVNPPKSERSNESFD